MLDSLHCARAWLLIVKIPPSYDLNGTGAETSVPKDGLSLPLYMTLLRTDRARAKDAWKGLKALPENHSSNLRVWYVASVFGEWDSCVWFEVDKPEHAMDFVQNEISKIPGIIHTYTLPTTPINEYWKHWQHWK